VPEGVRLFMRAADGEIGVPKHVEMVDAMLKGAS
jgi:hypothetical protein